MPFLIDCSSCGKYTPPSKLDPSKCQLCFDEDQAVKEIDEYYNLKGKQELESYLKTEFSKLSPEQIKKLLLDDP